MICQIKSILAFVLTALDTQKTAKFGVARFLGWIKKAIKGFVTLMNLAYLAAKIA